jgi:hypothetical protein
MHNKSAEIIVKNMWCGVWSEDEEKLIISFSYSKGPDRKFIRTLEWLDAPGELTSFYDSHMYHSDLFAGEAGRMIDEEIAEIHQTDKLTDYDIVAIRTHLQEFLSAH